MGTHINDMAHDCVMDAARNGDNIRGGFGALMGTLAALLFGFALLATCCGCASTYKGGKAVDGFDAEVAVKPSSESQFTIQFAHILSGFVFYWEANDSVMMTRETSNKWSAFGVIDGESKSVTKVKVEPCETQAATAEDSGD